MYRINVKCVAIFIENYEILLRNIHMDLKGFIYASLCPLPSQHVGPRKVFITRCPMSKFSMTGNHVDHLQPNQHAVAWLGHRICITPDITCPYIIWSSNECWHTMLMPIRPRDGTTSAHCSIIHTTSFYLFKLRYHEEDPAAACSPNPTPSPRRTKQRHERGRGGFRAVQTSNDPCKGIPNNWWPKHPLRQLWHISTGDCSPFHHDLSVAHTWRHGLLCALQS